MTSTPDPSSRNAPDFADHELPSVQQDEFDDDDEDGGRGGPIKDPKGMGGIRPEGTPE